MPIEKLKDESSAGAVGAAAGAGISMMFAMIIGFIGLLLCTSGFGAIIGIPMILVAAFTALGSPLTGASMVKGSCPHCGTQVFATKLRNGVTCPGCKKRVLL